jgi:hypothetical protein
MQHLAMGISQDLKLDVPRALDVLFDVDGAIPKSFLRLATCNVVFLGKGYIVVGNAHAAPAAASNRLNDNRITNFSRDLHRFGLGLNWPVGSRNDRNAGLLHGVLSNRLITHHLDGSRLGANELDITRLALLGKLGVFRKKTVAWMDRIYVGDLGRADNPIGPEVAFGALVSTDADRLIRELDVQRLNVCLGVNRQRLDAHLAASSHDAKSDFAAVGDEDFLDHGRIRN